MTETKFTKIISLPVDPSPGKTTEFYPTDKQGHTFRFVHIPAFLEHQTIEIYSTEILPDGAYACVSYPWWGLERDKTEAAIHFPKLQDYDNMVVRMLRTACAVAQKLGVEYLWIDKLCVRQDEPSDNAPDQLFQVRHMFDVYSKCKVCLVFAGGMSQLPKTTDMTRWIDRAWTLQEALAPPDVRVIFQWTYGSCKFQPYFMYAELDSGPVLVEQVVEEVGMSHLKPFLACSFLGMNKVLPIDDNVPLPQGAQDAGTVTFLNSLAEHKTAILRLLNAMNRTEADGRLNAIWRCLIIRQAQCKEDLIFSSMGIMGVSVNGDGIKNGTNYNDIEVTHLTMRLIQELVKKGNRAEWLGIAPECGPAFGYSGLPNMPLDRNVGHGYEKDNSGNIRPVNEDSEDNYWWLRNSPKDCIVHDDNEDVSFSSKAVPIEPNLDEALANDYLESQQYPGLLIDPRSQGQKVWTIRKDLKESKFYALFVGTKVWNAHGMFPDPSGPKPTLLMLIKKLESERYQNIGYICGDEGVTEGWEEVTFRIGG